MAQAWRVWTNTTNGDGEIKAELGYDDAAALPVLVNRVRYSNTATSPSALTLSFDFFRPASTFPDGTPLFSDSVPPGTAETTRNIPAGLNIRLKANARIPGGPLMPDDWVLTTQTG
jgi:hypothetical protein